MLLPSRNFIDNFFNDPFFERPFEHAASQIMKTDIHENDNSYLVEMELPGYKKEDIKADLKDGYLTVTASKNETKEEHDSRGKCIRKERYTGSCNLLCRQGADTGGHQGRILRRSPSLKHSEGSSESHRRTAKIYRNRVIQKVTAGKQVVYRFPAVTF